MHILDSLNRGGAEMLALDVCRNARRNALELTFVATGGGELEDDFRRSGVDFVRLRRRAPVDFALAARLREIMQERNVRIVHTHQAVECLHAYLASLGTKAARVMSFHLCAADAKNRLALRWLAPRMDANVAVSRDLLSCLKREGGTASRARNFHVVYNGVDAERLRSAGGDLRAEVKLRDGEQLLGMVGNFYPGARKDQMTVCRALPLLLRHSPHVHFVFAGGRAPDAPYIYDDCVSFCEREGISRNVHFLGQRADIPAVLRALDLFVFSSLQEGMPIAVIEAMMLGVPAVVSDILPLLEMTGGGRHAAVFRTGDADDLARTLAELIADPPRRARFGEEAQRWAMDQFSIEVHIANLKDLYRSLLTESGGWPERAKT